MAQWTNHVVLSLPRNGTTAHTVDPSNATGGGTVVAGTAFTPTAGRFLLIVMSGAVTSTTPTGWTLPTNGSALNSTGLYVWYRASAAGSDTMSTTHNGSNYSVAADVYEFPAGTTFVAAATGNNLANAAANPSVTAGTHSLLMAAVDMSQFGGSIATGVSWSGTPTPTKVADVSIVPSGTDGTYLSTAYADDTGASTYAPTGTYSGPFSEKEALTWSLSVPSGSAFSGSAAFTATVGLAAAGTPKPAQAASFTAAVSLTGSSTPAPSRASTLAASSSLTATAAPAASTAVSFTPTVSLSGSSGPAATTGAPLSATAGLTASAAPSITVAVPLTATVALTSSAAPALSGTASFTASPALTAAVIGGTSFTGTASLTATVALTSARTPGPGTPTPLTAVVALTAAPVSMTVASPAQLASTVTLTAANSPKVPAAAPLTSTVSLSAAPRPATVGAAYFTAAASLQAAVTAGTAWRDITVTIAALTGRGITATITSRTLTATAAGRPLTAKASI